MLLVGALGLELFEVLRDHWCHDVSVEVYGHPEHPEEMAIECLDCNETLIIAKGGDAV